MNCSHCGKDIPDDSLFCTYCGKEISNKNEKKTRKNKPKTRYYIICLLTLCIVLICTICYKEELHYKDIKKLNDEIIKVNSEYSTLKSLYDEKELMVAELTEELEEQKEEYSALNKKYIKVNRKTDLFKNTLDYLDASSNSNSYISTNSKIYCVKKGSSETIKVNWKANSTIYMGSNNYNIVDAEWVNHNVKITGKTEGVTVVFFGSNQSCSQNRFEVTVICY